MANNPKPKDDHQRPRWIMASFNEIVAYGKKHSGENHFTTDEEFFKFGMLMLRRKFRKELTRQGK